MTTTSTASATVTEQSLHAERVVEDDAALEEAIRLNIEMEGAVRFVPHGEKEALTLTRGEVRKVISKPTKFGELPTDRDIDLFLKLCEFRRLNPYLRDAYLIGYQKNKTDEPEWSIITAFQVLQKRADSHDEYQGNEHGIIVQRGDDVKSIECTIVPKGWSLIGGWAKIYRSDRQKSEHATAQFSAYAKPNKFWNSDPGWMIAKCALAKAYRGAFPNETEGMYIEEEQVIDRTPRGRTAIPTDNKTSLRDKLNEKAEAEKNRTVRAEKTQIGVEEDQPGNNDAEPSQLRRSDELKAELRRMTTASQVDIMRSAWIDKYPTHESTIHAICDARLASLAKVVPDINAELRRALSLGAVTAIRDKCMAAAESEEDQFEVSRLCDEREAAIREAKAQ